MDTQKQTHDVGSKAFSLNTADLKKIGKAFALQVLAVSCVFIVESLKSVSLPDYLLVVLPTVSTGLYALSRWATDRSENLYKIES
jgi:hypothetical protein